MELDELYSKLIALGIPVAYLKFNNSQSLPFIVYFEAGTEIKGADTFNLYREVTINIELYCKKKEVQLERKIENLFRDVEITKQMDTYIKEENMLMTAYSFKTIQSIEEEDENA